jgi:hypothetical protein
MCVWAPAALERSRAFLCTQAARRVICALIPIGPHSNSLQSRTHGRPSWSHRGPIRSRAQPKKRKIIPATSTSNQTIEARNNKVSLDMERSPRLGQNGTIELSQASRRAPRRLRQMETTRRRGPEARKGTSPIHITDRGRPGVTPAQKRDEEQGRGATAPHSPSI